MKNIKKGISLIETIVTIGIFTLIMAVMVSSLIFFYRANAFNIEQAFAVSSGRRGVEQMVQFIREATFAEDGSFPIAEIGTSTITFYSDIDLDNSVERVKFILSGSDFFKEVTNASGDPLSYAPTPDSVSTISDNVRNNLENTDIFEYFDSSGTQIGDFSEITEVAFIRVTLIVNINPTRLPNEFTLRSSATLRNLRVN